MDPELKQLMTQVQEKLGEQDQIKSAVTQLEEQMKQVPQTIENKVKAVRRSSWDPVGNYRGVFTDEAEARGFGLYVLATTAGNPDAKAALKSEFSDLHERAMGDSPDSGPNLVPVEFSQRIQRLVEEFGVFPADAFTMPMTSDKLTFSKRRSGLTVFKADTPSESDQSEPAWDTINLNAENWYVLTLYPRDLAADAAAAIGEIVAMEISQAFAQAIDDNGFAGDGTPGSLDVEGITKRLVDINGTDDGGGLVKASGSNGAGWGGITRDDFLKMIARSRFVRNGAFYCSAEFYWEVMVPIVLSAGGVTAGEMQGQRRLQAFGQPVRITPSMPRSEGNDQVACLYGELRRSSTHGVRQEMEVRQTDQGKYMVQDQVAVLGKQRHAINNHSLGDSTTAGPMVGLITPAA